MSNLNVAAGRQVAAEPVLTARDLQPWLSQQAGRIEAANRILEDVAARLVEAGLFRMSVPRRFGGLELCPSEISRAVFEVARGCASSAWIVGLVAANLMMVGKFSDLAQEEVFGGDRAAIVPMLTGGVGYDINVRQAEGGILLSGKWRYASGIDIASWVGLLITLPDDGEQSGRTVLVLVPKKSFDIDHESWRVLGMRGTGSKNVVLPEVFVPEHRMMDWATLQNGGHHPECSNDGAIFRYPLNSAFALSVAAPTLGVAGAVVETYRNTVRTRVASGTGQAQAQDRIAQISVAGGSAVIDLLEEGLVNGARNLTERVDRGEEIELTDRAMFRMRIATSTTIALREAQKIFRSVGGSLLPEGTALERSFRDLHAMSSHFLLQEEPIGELFGRILLDLELPTNARI
ncbi:acyl-CoA dehydrogenase family protein [Roseibium sediminicola]|uniref:Acyl-CoA dehydrogenase family protein n=1 Tax=Roseibium sediminicola TaxID=2933272 RepID=A0ABT0H4D8_9HYPH|nr:acyl-CoA dehydrogenase family protein [Roseibium sp. CAU 1639]MCK7615955.1 acyl-CoA dehydrogenase family protein [Roseibium sp. CAU 1639]